MVGRKEGRKEEESNYNFHDLLFVAVITTFTSVGDYTSLGDYMEFSLPACSQ